jgi:hypothetical protein
MYLIFDDLIVLMPKSSEKLDPSIGDDPEEKKRVLM